MSRLGATMMHEPISQMQYGGRGALPVGNGIIAGSGHGGLVRVIPKLQYSVPLTTGGTTDIVLAKYIDTTLWVSGQLIVRVHDRSFAGGASPTAAIVVQNTSFAEEDPSSDFVDTTAAAPVAAVTITSGSPTATPSLLVDTFTALVASQVRVILQLTQDAENTSAIDVTIGVDLVGRPA